MLRTTVDGDRSYNEKSTQIHDIQHKHMLYMVILLSIVQNRGLSPRVQWNAATESHGVFIDKYFANDGIRFIAYPSSASTFRHYVLFYTGDATLTECRQ